MISLSSLLKKVLTLYSAHFKTMFITLTLLIIWNVTTSVIPVSYANMFQVIGPVILVSIVIAAYTELALVKTFSGLLEDTPHPLPVIFTQALRRLPSFLLLLLGWFLSIVIGLIFLIIPAIIFGTWLMFLSSVCIIEGQGGLPAFKRSKMLVGGSFFPLLWRGAAIGIGTFLIVSAATEGLGAILGSIGPEHTLKYFQTATNAFGAILSALSLPIITGSIVTLYYEMRKPKS